MSGITGQKSVTKRTKDQTKNRQKIENCDLKPGLFFSHFIFFILCKFDHDFDFNFLNVCHSLVKFHQIIFRTSNRTSNRTLNRISNRTSVQFAMCPLFEFTSGNSSYELELDSAVNCPIYVPQFGEPFLWNYACKSGSVQRVDLMRDYFKAISRAQCKS